MVHGLLEVESGGHRFSGYAFGSVSLLPAVHCREMVFKDERPSLVVHISRKGLYTGKLPTVVRWVVGIQVPIILRLCW